MNTSLHTYLSTPGQLAEERRLADGIKFLTDLKKTAASPVQLLPPGAGTLEHSAVSALNTKMPAVPAAGAKQWVAGAKSAPRAPRMRKMAADGTEKVAIVADLLEGVAKASKGVAGSLKRDFQGIQETGAGFKEGVVGPHGTDYLGQPTRKGPIDKTIDFASRWDPRGFTDAKGVAHKGAWHRRPELQDPTQHSNAWTRFKTVFAPNHGGALSPVERDEAAIKQHVRERMARGKDAPWNAEEMAARNHYNGLKHGQDVANGVGTPGLYDKLHSTMTNADGSVGALSILHGARQMRWLDNEALKKGIGASVARVTGAGEANAAAEQHKRMLMLAGVGGGGLIAGGMAAKGLASKSD